MIVKCGVCGFENHDGALFCAGCGASLTSSDAVQAEGSAAPNSSLGMLGPYELLSELGRGAMARVWLARDTKLERMVAIKEPLFDVNLSDAMRDEMARRFVKEAKTAAGLNHPNIVTVFAADVYDGRPAIVMEWIQGVTLGKLIEAGPLSASEALRILDQLLDALAHAHAHGIVHRDIKPDNIFIDETGCVKLSDFGIAHADSSSTTHATVAGKVLGTPGYMSPEQAQGLPVDARSDLFSVGVVAYEMLAGRNPFGAGDGSDPVTLLYRIVHVPAPELPASTCAGLPADMRPAIMAALSKDPAYRPQNAAAFKNMLHGGIPVTQQGSGVGAAAPGVRPRGSGGKSRKWLPFAIVGAACVAAVAVALVFAMGSPKPVSAVVGVNPSNPGTSFVEEPSGTSSNMYYLGVSEGKVAIYSNSSAKPYRVTDVQAGDLTEEAVAEVDGNISFGSVADAESQIDVYRQQIKDAEEAARKAEEERAAEEQRKKEERERRPGEMLASLDGWWHAAFQGNVYAYIEGGSFYIYRPDIPGGKYFRTVDPSSMTFYENGLPGHFDGVPGYMIPRIADTDKNYYITDADFEDNGRIDMIAHINPDGSGYEEDQTFYRSERPDYAQ